MKTLSKREIADLYEGEGLQYRSQNMWSGNPSIEKESNMNNEAKEIIDLGRLHGKEDLAMDYIQDGKSLESFRKVLLEGNRSAELNLSRNDKEVVEAYSLGKAVRGIAIDLIMEEVLLTTIQDSLLVIVQIQQQVFGLCSVLQ